jgi:glutathione peroxidase
MKVAATFLGAMLACRLMAADKMNTIQDIPLNDINGQPTSLKAYAGEVVLLVNVASKCGFTKQYSGLESLYKKYKDKGLVVIGVPSNDFGGQEPGSADEIKAFCTSKYDVTFPLMAKIHVKGQEKHPLYVALTGPDAAFPGEVKWNFQKFVISRDGKVVARFPSQTTPESPQLVQAVETALAGK